MFVRCWNSRALQPQPFRCLDSSAEAWAGALRSCLADGLDAADRGTEAAVLGYNGDPCLCSVPAVLRVEEASYAGESHKESLLHGWKKSVAGCSLVFTACQHPVMKLALRHLQQLGKCSDSYFREGVGETEARNREVVCLRFYAAELEK